VTQVPGSMKNVTFRNIKATNLQAGTGSFISGVPGMIIDGVTLENIDFTYRGGVMDPAVARSTPPELEDGYPQWDMFGTDMPAYGLYVRHAKNVHLANVKFAFTNNDARPGLVFDTDVTGYRLTAPISIQKGTAASALVHRKDGEMTVRALPLPRPSMRAGTEASSWVNSNGRFLPVAGQEAWTPRFPGSRVPGGSVQSR
jgi:hypothetical protein